MSDHVRLGSRKPGDTLRLEVRYETGPYIDPRAVEASRREAERYPGDRCTPDDPAGRGLPSIKQDTTEWVKRMNTRYALILAAPLAVTARVALGGPGKIFDKMMWKLFMDDFLRDWLKEMRSADDHSAEKIKDPPKSNDGGAPAVGPLGGRGSAGGGRYTYDRVDGPRDKGDGGPFDKGETMFA